MRALLVVLLLALASVPGPGQRSRRSPAPVYVRLIQADPLLLASGVDTAALRKIVVSTLEQAALYQRDSASAPSLDVALSVPRSLAGVQPEPQALLSIEVGRNLMERGQRDRLVWESNRSLRDYPTWHALAIAIPALVRAALHDYAVPPQSGARDAVPMPPT